ncbi:MAG TPA: isopropylmalate isomerase [Planctomycetota bacterium]|jgi:3-isopropylmalate/(R)-2-methylmalate dehydratase small subunit|nr:isopropylmalate isomerase [Planctomycetota bacterium]
MPDLRRTRIAGRAVGIDGNDIDTDRIFPARRMLCVSFEGVGAFAFEDVRRKSREDGGLHPFDDPARSEARVLLVDRNFGCGSSREHAPQSLLRWKRGIAAIVGESFAKIFFGNCVALGIPCVSAAPEDLQALKRATAADPALEVVVDLEKKLVKAGPLTINVSIPDGPLGQFLTGRWDSVSELLEGREDVAALARTLPSFGPRENH